MGAPYAAAAGAPGLNCYELVRAGVQRLAGVALPAYDRADWRAGLRAERHRFDRMPHPPRNGWCVFACRGRTGVHLGLVADAMAVHALASAGQVVSEPLVVLQATAQWSRLRFYCLREAR